MRFLSALLLAMSLASGWQISAADRLSLAIDPFCGLPRVSMQGDPFDAYSLEAFDEMGSPLPWKTIMDLTLEAGGKSWCDSEARSLPRRFYRMVRLSAPLPEVNLRNFRLLDHTGKTRELYYSLTDPTVKAYVLLFTGDTCANLTPYRETLNRLVDQYSPEGIRFWGVSSLLGNSRSNLVKEVTALNLKFPVLHDRAEVVTREFGVTGVPEVVVVRNRTFRLLYRGAIEETNGVGGLESYLENALAKVLVDGTPNPSRVRPLGPLAGLHTRPVPSYNSHIAPLLQTKCITCHSPGNIAPWAMTNHQVVAMFADSIKDEILSARMPPWHADPHIGQFSNDSSLTPDEAASLLDWITAGSPRGEGPAPLIMRFQNRRLGLSALPT